MNRDVNLQNVDTYIKTELGLADTTRIAYLYDIKEFLCFANETLTAGLVEKYIKYLTDKKFKPNTIRRKIMSVRCLYNYLLSIDKIKIDEIKSIPSVTSTINTHLHLNDETFNKIISVLCGINLCRNLSILLLMYDSGLRVSEICSLEKKDILFKDKIIRVHGKGNKDRYVPTTQRCLDRINNHIQFNKNKSLKLFPDLSRRRISNIIKTLGMKIGLPNVSSHTLRRSCATQLFYNGMDVDLIQQILGHSNIGTTQRYINIDVEKLYHMYDKCHPFGVNYAREYS